MTDKDATPKKVGNPYPYEVPKVVPNPLTEAELEQRIKEESEK